jgi:hypothetical protein
MYIKRCNKQMPTRKNEEALADGALAHAPLQIK